MRNDNQLIFISGCCRGADALGERYAEENGFRAELVAEGEHYDYLAALYME